MGENEKGLIDIAELANKLTEDLTTLGEIGPGIETIEDLENVVWPQNALQLLQNGIDRIKSAWGTKLGELEQGLKDQAVARGEALASLEEKLLARAEGKVEVVPAGLETFTLGGFIKDRTTGNGLPFVTVKVYNSDYKFDLYTCTDELGHFKVDIGQGIFASWVSGATLSVAMIDASGKPQVATQQSVTPKAGQAGTVTIAVDAAATAPASFELSKAMSVVVTKLLEDYKYRREMLEARMLVLKREPF
jgi:hypothetical protein